jgi:chromosome segregation ATPase
MKVLDDLLRIKTHRETQAESQLAQASHALRAATEAVREAQARLDQAHDDYDARERALYEDLFSRLVHLGDLDIARAELDGMHEVIKERELALQAADEQRSSAQARREEMRILYRDASRTREKYSELSSRARSQRQLAEQHREELELEEVNMKRQEEETEAFGNSAEAGK